MGLPDIGLIELGRVRRGGAPWLRGRVIRRHGSTGNPVAGWRLVLTDAVSGVKQLALPDAILVPVPSVGPDALLPGLLERRGVGPARGFTGR